MKILKKIKSLFVDEPIIKQQYRVLITHRDSGGLEWSTYNLLGDYQEDSGSSNLNCIFLASKTYKLISCAAWPDFGKSVNYLITSTLTT